MTFGYHLLQKIVRKRQVLHHGSKFTLMFTHSLNMHYLDIFLLLKIIIQSMNMKIKTMINTQTTLITIAEHQKLGKSTTVAF